MSALVCAVAALIFLMLAWGLRRLGLPYPLIIAVAGTAAMLLLASNGVLGLSWPT